MVGAAFAAVPLYNLFCAVTGYGGTTQVATGEAGEILDREVTMYFDANTGRDHAVGLRAGPALPDGARRRERDWLIIAPQTHLISPVTGVASYNVAPFKAAPYFSKIECFCFVEQTLEPGESIDMPVLFFVDPLIDEERRLDDVTSITLSYTFFETEEGAEFDRKRRALALNLFLPGGYHRSLKG